MLAVKASVCSRSLSMIRTRPFIELSLAHQTDGQAASICGQAFWSAPAERSDDGALVYQAWEANPKRCRRFALPPHSKSRPHWPVVVSFSTIAGIDASDGTKFSNKP